MTYQEIADVLGISPQMVRRIEQRALQKAREILERRGFTLEDYLDECQRCGISAFSLHEGD